MLQSISTISNIQNYIDYDLNPQGSLISNFLDSSFDFVIHQMNKTLISFDEYKILYPRDVKTNELYNLLNLILKSYGNSDYDQNWKNNGTTLSC